MNSIQLMSDGRKGVLLRSDLFSLGTHIFEGNTTWKISFEANQWEIASYWKQTFLTCAAAVVQAVYVLRAGCIHLLHLLLFDIHANFELDVVPTICSGCNFPSYCYVKNPLYARHNCFYFISCQICRLDGLFGPLPTLCPPCHVIFTIHVEHVGSLLCVDCFFHAICQGFVQKHFHSKVIRTVRLFMAQSKLTIFRKLFDAIYFPK